MDEKRLCEIEARAEAASAGPWEFDPRIELITTPRDDGSHQPICEVNLWGNLNATTDAAFIAASREDVPALLAEVRRLRGFLSDLRHDAQNAMRWHNTTGMKVATPPALNFAAAHQLNRRLAHALGEEP